MNPDKTELEAFKREVSAKVSAYVYATGVDGENGWEDLKSLILPDTDEATPEQPPAPTLAEAARVVLAECDRRDAKGGELFDLLEDWANPPAPVDPLEAAWIEATGNIVGMGPLNEALAKRGLAIVAKERGE